MIAVWRSVRLRTLFIGYGAPAIAFLVYLFYWLLYLYGPPGVYFALLEGLGVPVWQYPFVDLQSVLQAIDCARQGVDVTLPNPCMGGGLFQYSPLVLKAAALPLGAGLFVPLGLGRVDKPQNGGSPGSARCDSTLISGEEIGGDPASADGRGVVHSGAFRGRERQSWRAAAGRPSSRRGRGLLDHAHRRTVARPAGRARQLELGAQAVPPLGQLRRLGLDPASARRRRRG